MKSKQELLDLIGEIHELCGTLLKKSEVLTASNDPKQRALGYEIGISVSKMTGEAKNVLKELNEMFPENIDGNLIDANY